MKKLFLLLISFAWLASAGNATSYAIPEGATPVDCLVSGIVAGVEDAGFQQQEISLKIESSEPTDEELKTDESKIDFEKACAITEASKVRYLYSSCDEAGECAVIAGGDGPKLAKGDKVNGIITLMVKGDYSIADAWFEYKRAAPKKDELFFPIFLKKGWNLIEMPYYEKLDASDCKAQNAWEYAGGKYEKTDLTKMAGGRVYWIYSQTQCTINYLKKEKPNELIEEYETGWNAVGPLFETLGRNCEIERGPFAWDAEEQKWIAVSHLEYGRGYFVKVKNNCGGGMVTEPNMVWASIQPKQCGTNAWNEWWAAGGGTEPEEEQLVRTWLSSQYGIEVSSYSQQQTAENVCLACSCPRGDTIKILVDEKDLPTLEELGFTEVARNA